MKYADRRIVRALTAKTLNWNGFQTKAIVVCHTLMHTPPHVDTHMCALLKNIRFLRMLYLKAMSASFIVRDLTTI